MSGDYKQLANTYKQLIVIAHFMMVPGKLYQLHF